MSLTGIVMDKNGAVLEIFTCKSNQAMGIAEVGRVPLPIRDCHSLNPLVRPAYEQVIEAALQKGWYNETGEVVPLTERTEMIRDPRDGMYYFRITLTPNNENRMLQ